MFTRLLAAVAALVLIAASPALGQPSVAIQRAEATTVQIRAHIHVHYLTAREIQKMSHQSNSPWYFFTNLASTKKSADDSNPDEDYYDTIVCSGYIAEQSISGTTLTDTVVTARHCTNPNVETFLGVPVEVVTITPTRLVLLDGESFPAGPIIRSTDSDLSLIQFTDNVTRQTASTRTTPMERGEPLEILGMPDGRPFYLSTGSSSMGDYETTADTDGADFAGLEVIECVSCFGGDSGAGVFDADGLVVGILDAGNDVPGFAAIVPAYRVRELLANHE